MIDRLRTRLGAGRQDGFTLIELLIVIVILGVLAGIVVFAVGGITDRGEASACDADRKTLEVASEAYYAKNKAYTDEAGLVAADLLRDQSDLYNVNSSGVLSVQSPKGTAQGCTV
ncbi:MAG TPA: prepilin-type N-terminal cleavage/methylation domain-containing protein [Mycobacteriales bacterium]|nr:prepilin-type N-terminal cleavage/methylation domain-containing protein [Mycobacteriales bacterium]